MRNVSKILVFFVQLSYFGLGLKSKLLRNCWGWESTTQVVMRLYTLSEENVASRKHNKDNFCEQILAISTTLYTSGI